MDEEGLVVMQTIDVNNFQILNLINGGTLKSEGLFSIRTVKKWSGKTSNGRPMSTYELQIVTKGINSYIPQNNVTIKKVKEKVIVEKEVPQYIKTPQTKLKDVEDIETEELM